MSLYSGEGHNCAIPFKFQVSSSSLLLFLSLKWLTQTGASCFYYVHLRLARTYVYLFWLVFTLVEFKFSRGSTRSIHDRGAQRMFFGWKFTPSGIFGSRDLARFFYWINQHWGISSYIFLGRKFWCQLFFCGQNFRLMFFFFLGGGGCNMKRCRTPPSCILLSPPGTQVNSSFSPFGQSTQVNANLLFTSNTK